MKKLATLSILIGAAALAGAPPAHRWPVPKTPVVSGADGYAAIPNAAVPPTKTRTYKAIFDATRAADKPGDLAPAISNAASELNAFGVAGVPAGKVKLAVVFHGSAMAAILDDAHYRAKFGVANPNLPVLRQMKKAGTELYVCGQNLVADDVDPGTLAPEIRIASDALIVLMTYQNDGYALISY
jgi:intracellular sulfur oxidation DsrE/DsrF family protein